MTAASPQITTIRADITIPEKKSKGGRGSRSAYPFDKLEIGQSFGVANKTKKQLASIISNQNKRFAVDKLDANGKPIFRTIEIEVDGVKKSHTTENKVTEPGRTFIAVEVDSETDPDGAMVRIFRTK